MLSEDIQQNNEVYGLDTSETVMEMYSEMTVNTPVSGLRDLVERELDKYRGQKHFDSYDTCVVFKNLTGGNAPQYKMILFKYRDNIVRPKPGEQGKFSYYAETYVFANLGGKLNKNPVNEAKAEKGYFTVQIIGEMEYGEQLRITIDRAGDEVTKISSGFVMKGVVDKDDLFGRGYYPVYTYSSVKPLPYKNFTNKEGVDKFSDALQQAAHSRLPLKLRDPINPDVCNGMKYFTYVKSISKNDRYDVFKGRDNPGKYTKGCCTFMSFLGGDTWGSNSAYPMESYGYNPKTQKWEHITGGASAVVPDNTPGVFTNHQRVRAMADYVNSTRPDYEHFGAIIDVKHPYEIGDVGFTDKDCAGDPIDPDNLPNPPSGNTGLPTGHKYYLKCIEGTVQVCFTFDGFQHRDGNWNINASNGRILKYIHDGGCWHFFTSYSASHQIKTVIKDVVTNNKDLHDFLMKNKGKHTGKLIYNGNPVDVSPYYWQKSKNLYFASWTSLEKSEDPKKQTWYLALFDFADGNTIRKPGGVTTTPIVAHFENGKIVKLSAPWNDYKNDWKPEGEYKEYRFDKQPKYNNFQTNHRVLYGWLERHGRLAGNHSKFISPCTQIKPDGTLPDGVIGPPLPPAVKPPSNGNNEPLGPDKPGQPNTGDGPITQNDITCVLEKDPLRCVSNDKLNGLYYYYLEYSLFGVNEINTQILGTTPAIANVAYVPFLNIKAGDLCKVKFDVDRYGKDIASKDVPTVFRLKGSFAPETMKVANWKAYPTNTVSTKGRSGVPWQWHHESRLLDYPYRKVAFVSNIFDMYDIVPHLHLESAQTNNVELKVCTPVTPGGNFYAWVNGYKGDTLGLTERQFTTTSMDIPNTSSAYSNYMSTQKSQAANNGIIKPITGAAIGATVGSIVPGFGTAIGAVVGGGVGMLNSIMDNMAVRADMATTPKSLTSMGGDVLARLGCTGKPTIMACDFEITPQYKDRIARFFHMFGTKQSRVLDVQSNINSRYYFNYIKTCGCNVSSNGVPKKHVAKIKAIMDRGTTFWHLDRSGVNFGEYCVYDNSEI